MRHIQLEAGKHKPLEVQVCSQYLQLGTVAAQWYPIDLICDSGRDSWRHLDMLDSDAS
jgi:hypothetical protein